MAGHTKAYHSSFARGVDEHGTKKYLAADAMNEPKGR
jgi:hypothetical protein